MQRMTQLIQAINLIMIETRTERIHIYTIFTGFENFIHLNRKKVMSERQRKENFYIYVHSQSYNIDKGKENVLKENSL